MHVVTKQKHVEYVRVGGGVRRHVGLSSNIVRVARDDNHIFQFDTPLWSHNGELLGRTLFVILYFCCVLPQLFIIFAPHGTHKSYNKLCRLEFEG